MSRGVTCTVRAGQSPRLSDAVHKVVKRNASQADLVQVRSRVGAVIHERIGGAIGGVPVEHEYQPKQPYVIVDVYIDDLKRLVAVLAEVGDTNNQSRGKHDDNDTDEAKTGAAD